ncbi:hypothetical protein R3X27_15470 [Tropicimonas sp. TH_r6]|uniref:hypothetical protein n=1 Tax=Tropicimonas sp. TH_r6 TaxID=3082085 RepID=UPI0029534A4D|nr:hypothetical protein [Tropicimonas sp. TH_r6]MDV7144087.1 hypothetical protein [Tropicimonas sp. TH_r6]
MSGWYNAEGPINPTPSNLASENTAHEVRAVVGGGGVELTFDGDGNATMKQSLSGGYNVSSQETYQGRNDILGTARDAGNGVIHARPLTNNDTVDVGGMRTNIATAISLGFLERDGNGGYREGSATVAQPGKPEAAPAPQDQTQDEAQQENPNAAPEGNEQPTEGAVDVNTEALAAKIAETTSPQSQINMVESVIHQGEVIPRVIERMAKDAGMEPDEMGEQVEALHAGLYQAGVEEFASRVGGFENEAFDRFLTSDRRAVEMVQDVARDWATNRGTSGMDDLADRYLERMDQFQPDEVKAALDEGEYGHTVRPDGSILVTLPDGTEVPWRVAVRQQLITFL